MISSKIDALLLRMREVQEKTLTSSNPQQLHGLLERADTNQRVKACDDFYKNCSAWSLSLGHHDINDLHGDLAVALEKLQRFSPFKTPVREWYRATVAVWDLLIQPLNRVVIPTHPTTQKVLQGAKSRFLEEILTLKSALKELQYQQLRVVKKFMETPKNLECLEKQRHDLTVQLESTMGLLAQKNELLNDACDMINDLKAELQHEAERKNEDAKQCAFDVPQQDSDLTHTYQFVCQRNTQLEEELKCITVEKDVLNERIQSLENEICSSKKETSAWLKESQKKEEMICGLEKLLSKAGSSLQELELSDAAKEEKIFNLTKALHCLQQKRSTFHNARTFPVCLAVRPGSVPSFGIYLALSFYSAKPLIQRTSPIPLFYKAFFPMKPKNFLKFTYSFTVSPKTRIEASTQCSSMKQAWNKMQTKALFQITLSSSSSGINKTNTESQTERPLGAAQNFLSRQHFQQYQQHPCGVQIEKFARISYHLFHSLPQHGPMLEMSRIICHFQQTKLKSSNSLYDFLDDPEEVKRTKPFPTVNSCQTFNSAELKPPEVDIAVSRESLCNQSEWSRECFIKRVREKSPTSFRSNSCSSIDAFKFQQCASPLVKRPLDSGQTYPSVWDGTISTLKRAAPQALCVLDPKDSDSMSLRDPCLRESTHTSLLKTARTMSTVDQSVEQGEKKIYRNSRSNSFCSSTHRSFTPNAIEEFLFSKFQNSGNKQHDLYKKKKCKNGQTKITRRSLPSNHTNQVFECLSSRFAQTSYMGTFRKSGITRDYANCFGKSEIMTHFVKLPFMCNVDVLSVPESWKFPSTERVSREVTLKKSYSVDVIRQESTRDSFHENLIPSDDQCTEPKLLTPVPGDSKVIRDSINSALKQSESLEPFQQPFENNSSFQERLEELKKHYDKMMNQQYSLLERVLNNRNLGIEREWEAEKEELTKRYEAEQKECVYLRTIIQHLMDKQTAVEFSKDVKAIESPFDVLTCFQNRSTSEKLYSGTRENCTSLLETSILDEEEQHSMHYEDSSMIRKKKRSPVYNNPHKCGNLPGVKASNRVSAKTVPSERLCQDSFGQQTCNASSAKNVQKSRTSQTFCAAKELADKLTSPLKTPMTPTFDSCTSEEELLMNLSRVRQNMAQFLSSSNFLT